MKFEKKLIILSGDSFAKGTLTLERNAFGMFATFSVYNLPDLNEGEYAAGIKNAEKTFVRKLGSLGRIIIRFKIEDTDLSAIHCVIFDTVSEQPLLYGSNAQVKLWHANMMDGFKERGNAATERLLSDGAGNSGNIGDFFLDIFPRTDPRYMDNAVAAVNYYPGNMSIEVEYSDRNGVEPEMNPVDKAAKERAEALLEGVSDAEINAAKTEADAESDFEEDAELKPDTEFTLKPDTEFTPKSEAEPKFNKGERNNNVSFDYKDTAINANDMRSDTIKAESVSNENERIQAENKMNNDTTNSDTVQSSANENERIQAKDNKKTHITSQNECNYTEICDDEHITVFEPQFSGGGGSGKTSGDKSNKDSQGAPETLFGTAAKTNQRGLKGASIKVNKSDGTDNGVSINTDKSGTEYNGSSINTDKGGGIDSSVGKSAKILSAKGSQDKSSIVNDEAAATVPSLSQYTADKAIHSFSGETIFYELVKEQIDDLFENNSRFEPLEKMMPDTKWVKVDYDSNGKYYLVGLIGSKPDYICYGVSARYSPEPPKDLSGYCRWLPSDQENPEGEGFWLMFQDAISGESIKAEF